MTSKDEMREKLEFWNEEAKTIVIELQKTLLKKLNKISDQYDRTSVYHLLIVNLIMNYLQSSIDKDYHEEVLELIKGFTMNQIKKHYEMIETNDPKRKKFQIEI